MNTREAIAARIIQLCNRAAGNHQKHTQRRKQESGYGYNQEVVRRV